MYRPTASTYLAMWTCTSWRLKRMHLGWIGIIIYNINNCIPAARVCLVCTSSSLVLSASCFLHLKSELGKYHVHCDQLTEIFNTVASNTNLYVNHAHLLLAFSQGPTCHPNIAKFGWPQNSCGKTLGFFLARYCGQYVRPPSWSPSLNLVSLLGLKIEFHTCLEKPQRISDWSILIFL